MIFFLTNRRKSFQQLPTWIMLGSLSVVLGSIAARAQSPQTDESQIRPFYSMTDDEIARTLKDIHKKHPSFPEKIAAVSEYFLTTPYRWGPLGEGQWGQFDGDPLINFKQADCTTFVEQTIALSRESKLNNAIRTLQKIRYRDGKIAYESRNHFPEADWIPNNVAAGFIKDITRQIGGDQTQTVTKFIRKREWYASKTLKDLDGFEQASKKDRRERLKNLRALATPDENGKFRIEEDRQYSIDFVPLSMLPRIKDKIPSGVIANLVREDNPKMPVLVSHQVLLIDKNGGKYVRHASQAAGVEDVPMFEYFYRYFGSSWKLLGLNFNEIRDPYAKR